jgi:hypothetical protein
LILHESPGSHANTQRHLVALDTNRACVGLKVANAIAEGTQRECIISDLSTLLAMPLAPRKRLIQPIANLPKIGGQDFVADRWYHGAEALDKLATVPEGPAIRQAVTNTPDPLLVDYGEWLGFGLLFAVNDRSNAGNWICSATGPTIGMFDTESSLSGIAAHADYRFPLQFFNLLQAVNAPPAGGTHNVHRAAVSRGLRQLYKKWAGWHKSVGEILSKNPPSVGYRSDWMRLGHKQFINRALTGLA